MNECPNCGRCCGYDGDGRLVCVCGYHEEAQYDVAYDAVRGDPSACVVRRDVLTPPASAPGEQTR